MMMLALKNVSTVRIKQNQHWPGNKHGFLTLLSARTKNTVLIYVALAVHQSSSVFFFMPMSDIFLENLSSFCDNSRSSTSIVLRIGSICSHELANI